MKVMVGTKNPVKVMGVRRAFSRYFDDVEVLSKDVASGVGEQPFNQQTVTGAVNRAKNAYSEDCSFSVGIEAGLFSCPSTITGYIDFQVACIFDGKRYTIGFGPGFEYPPAVVALVLEGRAVGSVMEELTGMKELGRKKGAIGYLSKDVIRREDLTEIAVTMALIPWINRDIYGL